VQSLGLGFGAGVGVPELGLLLCNRLGRSSTLDPGHANRCRPGRRPVNTIFPWSVSDAGGLRWLGGTPGGDGQTQWNAQTLAAMLLDGLDPLRALTLPHWTSYPGADKVEAAMRPHLQLDDTVEDAVVTELEARGHEVVRKASVGGVTRVLGRLPGGCAYGLDDGRQEGLTAGS
jgi:gamma-glutamyltranspeptidase/glutathione hydrolase